MEAKRPFTPEMHVLAAILPLHLDCILIAVVIRLDRILIAVIIHSHRQKSHYKECNYTCITIPYAINLNPGVQNTGRRPISKRRNLT